MSKPTPQNKHKKELKRKAHRKWVKKVGIYSKKKKKGKLVI